MTQSLPTVKIGPDGPLDQHLLTDRFGRIFNYLRIAVVERCNLRCIYCMPEEGIPFTARKELLTTDELLRVVRAGTGLGIRKIRYTGGEPLLHPDIVALIAGAASQPGIDSVHLTTNGVLLSRLAGELRQAGLSGVNISLDTLREDRFASITRRSELAAVLAGLEAAQTAGFESIKINVVALRGFNDDEIIDFAEMTRDADLTVRFIELMPFDAHQIWKTGTFLRLDVVRQQLASEYGVLEAADGSATETEAFRIPGFRGKVALIPAYTRSLCSACNRVRLTADGKLRNCLYGKHEYDLKAVLRAGGSAEDIRDLLREAVGHKARDGWAAQEEAVDGGGRERVSMTQIGG